MLERLKLVGQFLVDLPKLPLIIYEDYFQSKSLAEDPKSEWFMDSAVWQRASHVKEAPPWKVFPNVLDGYPAVNQGENEFYMNVWAEWFNALCDAEKDNYLVEYGAPAPWFDRFNSRGSWNRPLSSRL